MDEEKFRKTIGKVKPKFSGKDYFMRKCHNLTKDTIDEKPWKTIFNSEMACLKSIQEILDEMKAQNKEFWDDPEFGPTSSDP